MVLNEKKAYAWNNDADTAKWSACRPNFPALLMERRNRAGFSPQIFAIICKFIYLFIIIMIRWFYWHHLNLYSFLELNWKDIVLTNALHEDLYPIKEIIAKLWFLAAIGLARPTTFQLNVSLINVIANRCIKI